MEQPGAALLHCAAGTEGSSRGRGQAPPPVRPLHQAQMSAVPAGAARHHEAGQVAHAGVLEAASQVPAGAQTSVAESHGSAEI